MHRRRHLFFLMAHFWSIFNLSTHYGTNLNGQHDDFSHRHEFNDGSKRTRKAIVQTNGSLYSTTLHANANGHYYKAQTTIRRRRQPPPTDDANGRREWRVPYRSPSVQLQDNLRQQLQEDAGPPPPFQSAPDNLMERFLARSNPAVLANRYLQGELPRYHDTFPEDLPAWGPSDFFETPRDFGRFARIPSPPRYNSRPPSRVGLARGPDRFPNVQQIDENEDMAQLNRRGRVAQRRRQPSPYENIGPGGRSRRPSPLEGPSYESVVGPSGRGRSRSPSSRRGSRRQSPSRENSPRRRGQRGRSPQRVADAPHGGLHGPPRGGRGLGQRMSHELARNGPAPPNRGWLGRGGGGSGWLGRGPGK